MEVEVTTLEYPFFVIGSGEKMSSSEILELMRLFPPSMLGLTEICGVGEHEFGDGLGDSQRLLVPYEGYSIYRSEDFSNVVISTAIPPDGRSVAISTQLQDDSIRIPCRRVHRIIKVES